MKKQKNVGKRPFESVKNVGKQLFESAKNVGKRLQPLYSCDIINIQLEYKLYDAEMYIDKKEALLITKDLVNAKKYHSDMEEEYT